MLLKPRRLDDKAEPREPEKKEKMDREKNDAELLIEPVQALVYTPIDKGSAS